MLVVGNYCYVAVWSAAEGAYAPMGRRGAGHTVAAARLQLVIVIIIVPKGRCLCAKG